LHSFYEPTSTSYVSSSCTSFSSSSTCTWIGYVPSSVNVKGAEYSPSFVSSASTFSRSSSASSFSISYVTFAPVNASFSIWRCVLCSTSSSVLTSSGSTYCKLTLSSSLCSLLTSSSTEPSLTMMSSKVIVCQSLALT